MRCRRLGTLSLTSLLLVLGAMAARADPPSITDAAYADRLGTTIDALMRLPAGARDPASIESVLLTLGLPLAVELPGGRSATVTEDALVGDALTLPDAYAATLVRLGSAKDQVAATQSASGTDPGTVERALDGAYAGGAAESPSLLYRITSAVVQALGWILDRTLGALIRAGMDGLVALIAIGALLAIAVVVLRKAGTGLVADYRAPGAPRATAIDWRAEAERALAAGDLQAAVRAWYHVLLEVLASHGVVHDAPGLTAGECREAVRVARPALYPDIRTATLTFERVAYGDDPAAPEDVALLCDAERKVRAS